MNRTTIFDYLVANGPSGIQYVDPYQDGVPTPNTNYCSLSLLPVQDVGNSQYRTISKTVEGETVYGQEFSQERIYTVQFDCFGDSGALDMCLNIRSVLKDFFNHNNDTTFNIKEVTDVENLSFLAENKSYLERYTFRMSFFIIDKREDYGMTTLEKVVPLVQIIAK